MSETTGPSYERGGWLWVVADTEIGRGQYDGESSLIYLRLRGGSTMGAHRQDVHRALADAERRAAAKAAQEAVEIGEAQRRLGERSARLASLLRSLSASLADQDGGEPLAAEVER